MKKSKKFKCLVIALVCVTLFMCFVGVVNASGTIYNYVGNVYVKSNNKYVFNYRELMDIYAKNSTGNNIKYLYPYDVTKQMVEDKTAVKLTGCGFDDGVVDASDVSSLLLAKCIYDDSDMVSVQQVLSNLETTLGYKKDAIELRLTAYKPEDNKSIICSNKTTKEEDLVKIMEDSKEDFVKEILEGNPDVTAEQAKTAVDSLSFDTLCVEYFSRRLSRLDAIMPDGAEYTLVIAGENYEYNNWFMVRTKEAPKEEPPVQEEPKKEFKTDLSYIAIVDGNNVDGTLKDGTYYPNYDRTKVEKDANVTAKITSTTKTDIVKINGVDLNPDGTKNSLGWYYADKSDKTVIVKDYPFDKVDNTTDNGIVIEKDLELTSIDGLKDKETVSIEWPFRIIDLTQTPEKIDDKTEKTTVTITTNLPMEEEKLPDGWKFTDDEEGKTQHRIYKEFYKKDGNKEEDVVVIANNRDDKDNTQVKVVWPKEQPKEEPKEELPEKIPQTGKNFGLVIAIISLAGVSAITYRKFRK